MNEGAHEAALRELIGEKGLPGKVLRHLWSMEHEDRVADYFLVAVPVAPVLVSGPETQGMSWGNTDVPCWIPVADLDRENLLPATMGHSFASWPRRGELYGHDRRAEL